MRLFEGIRFDRNELAGAFGDLGTVLPLIVGMILAARLDCASVLIMFGLMQIFTGLRYRIPMPVQPLKAMATLVIAQKLSGSILYGAGLAIGVIMLFLTLSGLLVRLGRIIPPTVVRGLQFGLALQLGILALREYVPSSGPSGMALALVAFLIGLVFLGNRRMPAALLLIGLGVVFACFKLQPQQVAESLALHVPLLHLPGWSDIAQGFLLLALPQLPLSLGNSILATRQVSHDLFPERSMRLKTIGLTYSLMNLVNPFLGGIPTCHGAGGMAGHYAFGGRTGGSVVICGLTFIGVGLFLSQGFAALVAAFPLPVLGILLLFEALSLIGLTRVDSRGDFLVVTLVGLLAVGLPYGFLIGMLVGTLVVALSPHLSYFRT
ncbi:transporter [bacterium CPR1]|nr:transporter [bacterium CPR1]